MGWGMEEETPYVEEPQPKIIQVFIMTLSGNLLIEDLELNSPVEALKAKIEEKEQVPHDQQRLVYAGKQLDDGRTLAYYNMQNER
jgi:hypothetical protein